MFMDSDLVRALLADQNNSLSNFGLSTMVLPHIIEHPCDPDSPDFDLNVQMIGFRPRGFSSFGYFYLSDDQALKVQR